MANHAQVAASVRRNKEAHPERYCPIPNCLWRSGGKCCPKHKHLEGLKYGKTTA